MDEVLVSRIYQMGFPPEKGKLIHAFVGGSTLHGVKLEGKDDLDLYGIFIEDPLYVCGLDRFEHFVTSTASQGERNTADDVDVTCYSLRKWVNLALKGNPTVLQFLFTPAGRGDIWWSGVMLHRSSFLAKSHGRQYMGYADAQLRRMTGERGTGRHGQRPELINAHGYDSKAAMHTLRILLEGIELMRSGWITLPRPAAERDWLLEVRRGEWSADRVISEANKLFSVLRDQMNSSDLPEEVDRQEVSMFVRDTYLNSWGYQ